MIKYILISIIALTLAAEASDDRDIGLSLKVNRSIGIIPIQGIQLSEQNEETVNLLTGTFGFGAELLYRSKRRMYFNLLVEYNSLLVNDNFHDLNGNTLNGSFFKIGFSGIGYFNPPDEFTPYIGYGIGFIFINTNQDELYTYDSGSYDDVKGDLFSAFSVSFDLKGGLLFPISKQFSITTDIDFSVYFATHLGLVPKVRLGGIYWLK